MSVCLIPRPEALLKLVAVEPITHGEVIRACGWPEAELRAIVRDLSARGLLGWAHRDGARFYCLGISERTRQRRAKKAVAA